LLSGAVLAVEQLGWAGTSVAHITARARVSRRTFYDLFSNREDCLAAVIEDTVGLIAAELAAVDLAGLSWRERVRTGLWTILCFFDREPHLARVCVVHSAQAGQRLLDVRGEVFGLLADALDEGRREGNARASELPGVTAEGLVGAAVAILHKRLATGSSRPLSDLQGELMSMIVLPYLGSAAAIRERKRPAPEPLASSANVVGVGGDAWMEDPLREIPMRLTYRTARVLEVTAEIPGASNRMIGEGAGIYDQGQVSKLLARLEKLGLLANTGEGQPKGSANVWHLTATGVRVTDSIRARTQSPGQQVAS
jgi:AcrR family transcriptional regulator